MMAQKIIENTNQRIPPQCKNVSGEHTDPEDVNFQCEIVDKSSVEEYMIMVREAVKKKEKIMKTAWGCLT